MLQPGHLTHSQSHSFEVRYHTLPLSSPPPLPLPLPPLLSETASTHTTDTTRPNSTSDITIREKKKGGKIGVDIKICQVMTDKVCKQKKK